jgi:hypothetical protein
MTTQTPARRFRRWLVSVGLAAIIDGGFPAAAEAAGPWRAQVVDAETGQPLEGVAVIAVWQRGFSGTGSCHSGRRRWSPRTSHLSRRAGRCLGGRHQSGLRRCGESRRRAVG